MLRQIIIENFALIERAEFHLAKGFSVVTGESGAGKSLFIKALNMLLGARAETRLIGPFNKKASIQAIFDVPDDFYKFFEERGLEFDNEIIIRRIIALEGKGKVFINGNLCTLSELRALTSRFLTIASQHEFHKLLDRDSQRQLLDAFSNVDLTRLDVLYLETKKIREKLQRLLKIKEKRLQREEELLSEAKLIDEVCPEEGEEDRLIEEKEVLKATERLRSLGSRLYQILNGERESVVERLGECRSLIDKLSMIDQKLEFLSQQISSLEIEASEISQEIRNYLYDLPHDDSRLREVEERLYQIRQLKRRFGPSVKDIIRYRQQIDKELEEMESVETEIKSLSKKLDDKEKELLNEALRIRKIRREGAKELVKAIKDELRDLNLDSARFEILLIGSQEPCAKDVGPHGLDEVEFLFCANPGRPLDPLSKVASGGELSRILLALKVILGKRSDSDIVIFDEIDAGLGGELAENVGKKLRQISNSCQVIAITHFPQIAAMAQEHIYVQKVQKEGQTITKFKILSQQERLDELVRMLGGDKRGARRYAQEMLSALFRRP